MARLEQRWERRTPVPPAKARAWWFDLREDDHAAQEYQEDGDTAGRRVVERTADMVRTEDTWKGWTFPAVVRKDGSDALAYEIGQGKYVHRATLRFAPDGAGTRMTWHGVADAQGLMGAFMALGKRRVLREFVEDMELHARHMEREWRERPW